MHKCKRCKKAFYREPSSRRQYCAPCKAKVRAEQVQAAHDREVERSGGAVGVGSGGNQWGENNPLWNGGTRSYRGIALADHDPVCALCTSSINVLIHHIDSNRKNNRIENLIPLCKTCHGVVHAVEGTYEPKHRRTNARRKKGHKAR
jgi:hypothetical protein